MDVKRTGIILKPSNSRVVIRPFEIASENRVEKIIARVSSLPESAVESLLAGVMREFRERHQRTREFFLHRFDQVRRHLLTDEPVSESRRLLIGSYFTQEYALESAALFNPSMVWHPDQSGLPAGSSRFILSLRATGEGHISSITFRSGVIDAGNFIHMDEPTRFVAAPDLVPNALYEKALFHRKLTELGVDGTATEQVMTPLGEHFTLDELEYTLQNVLRHNRARQRELEPVAQHHGDAGEGQLRDPLPPRPRRLGADHLPLIAHRDQRDRGCPVRSLHARRRPDLLLRHLHRLRRPGHLPADARDRGLPPLQGQHPERAGGPEQGVRPLPPDDPRPVCDALPPGQREHLPDVLRHAPLLVQQDADRQTDLCLGVRPARQLRLADRDRRRLAGPHPRRRADAEVRPGRLPASTGTIPRASSAGWRLPSWSRTPTNAKGTCPTSFTVVAPSRTGAT